MYTSHFNFLSSWFVFLLILIYNIKPHTMSALADFPFICSTSWNANPLTNYLGQHHSMHTNDKSSLEREVISAQNSKKHRSIELHSNQTIPEISFRPLVAAVEQKLNEEGVKEISVKNKCSIDVLLNSSPPSSPRPLNACDMTENAKLSTKPEDIKKINKKRSDRPDYDSPSPSQLSENRRYEQYPVTYDHDPWIRLLRSRLALCDQYHLQSLLLANDELQKGLYQPTIHQAAWAGQACGRRTTPPSYHPYMSFPAQTATVWAQSWESNGAALLEEERQERRRVQNREAQRRLRERVKERELQAVGAATEAPAGAGSAIVA